MNYLYNERLYSILIWSVGDQRSNPVDIKAVTL